MKNSKIHPLVTAATFLVLAIATAYLALVMAQPSIDLLRMGVRVKATIVEVVEVHQADFDGFAPIVLFNDQLGNEQRVQCNFATGQPTWRVGDKLEMIYPADRPKEACTTHWWDLWGMALIPFVACLLFLLVSGSVFWRFVWSWTRTVGS